jgi:hypothetical protein
MKLTGSHVRPMRILGGIRTRPVSSSLYLLGVLLLVLGFAMPWGLNQQATASSASIPSGTSTISIHDCPPESSSTFTTGNLTHTAVSVRNCDTQNWSDQIVRSRGPGPGSLSLAQSSISATLSIVVSVGLAVIAMSLQNEKFRKIGRPVLLPSACALWFLSIAIAAAIYDALLPPLSGLGPDPFLVYSSLVMTFSGFGFSMFALAGALRNGNL